MFCFQVPERDNGCPVVRYTLEMQELPAGFSAERDMNVGKKLGKSKKVCNHQDDVVVQPTTTRGWVVVYHGQELLYVFRHPGSSLFSSTCDQLLIQIWGSNNELSKLTDVPYMNACMGDRHRSQVTGLAPCREYRFRVKAQNSVGTSSPSSALVAKSLPAAPGAPQPPTFSKVTSTSVQIKWSPPANDNGMPLTRYTTLLISLEPPAGFPQ
jgi:hypothetical protein